MPSSEPFSLDLPEDLSDEAATQLIACLYELARVLENRYFAQLHRYAQQAEAPQLALWSHPEDP